MLPRTGERSQRHTILHVSFGNSFGLASAQPPPTGFVGCASFSHISNMFIAKILFYTHYNLSLILIIKKGKRITKIPLPLYQRLYKA